MSDVKDSERVELIKPVPFPNLVKAYSSHVVFLSLSETKKNLQYIIDSVREKNPATKIVLAGMQIPPNMGSEYTNEFRTIFPELAQKNNLPLIPFLLEGVAGEPELNQADGIHPTIEGHKIVAENAWAVLEDLVID